MPNWCDVTISIESRDKDKIKDIWEIIWADGDSEKSYETDNANLMNLRPIPEDIGDNGRGWAVEHWGTKWYMDIGVCELHDLGITISGLTAWSPPLELLDYVAKKWEVSVACSYYEEGLDFVGSAYYTPLGEYLSEGTISDNVTPIEDWENHDWSQHMDEIDELIDQHESNVLRQAGIAV